jgi:RNA polymerase sigma-B factor
VTPQARQDIVRRYVADPSLPNRNDLIGAYQYLCRRGARKFYRKTVDRADLEQIAAVGLIKASQRYNQTYQTPFEAYAWLMIVGELMHYVRDYERIVRVPRTLRSLERRYSAAYEKLTAEMQREPTVHELASELDVHPALIDEIRAFRGHGLREDDDENDAMFRFSELPAERVVSCLEEASYTLEDRIALHQALLQLSQREIRIVRDVFYNRRSQSEVGRSLGISQRQVSRVLARTLQRLARLIAA